MNRKYRIIFTASFCCAAVLILVGYTLYTGHIWEDFFITFRCSKNLAEGNGLVYQIGQRVHVFTSPLGVLLPALTYLISGKQSYYEAIWLFRIFFCIPAFIAGGFFIFKMFLEHINIENKLEVKNTWQNSYLLFIFIGLFYIFDVKSVMFTMNGMETGLMLFFFMWALYLLIKGIDKNWFMTGISWGGMMWTRPDSCFYIAALIVSSIFFAKNRKGKKSQDALSPHSKMTFSKWFSERKSIIISILKASGVTTVIYLPWFVWAWIYYGSPVPNTVLAKSAVSSMNIANFFKNILIYPSWAFSPVYPHLSKWPEAVKYFSIFLFLFCALYWLLIPLKDRFGKKLSFTFFLISLYFALMPFPYPWYYPPLTILGYIIIVNGVWRISKRISFSSTFSAVCYCLLLLNFLLQFVLSTYQMKMQQELIENRLRKQIGFWLKDHKKPGDTIYLEPLGYIGYFSEGKMSDFPGLATPENVRLIKEEGCDFYTLILKTEPDWVIARLFRRKGLESMKAFMKKYEHIGDFSVIEKIKDAGNIPGRGYLEYDSAFKIYRKKK